MHSRIVKIYYSSTCVSQINISFWGFSVQINVVCCILGRFLSSSIRRLVCEFWTILMDFVNYKMSKMDYV